VTTSLLPATAPVEVRDGYTLVARWDDAALVNCDSCGLDLGVWTDKAGVVLPEYVTILARHLFTAHHVNHLIHAAEGKHEQHP